MALPTSLVPLLLTLVEGVVQGSNCQYLDLCALASREAPPCGPGYKFLVRGERGVRRQFLASPTSSLVVFLSRGLKVTDCLELEEMTESTTCKEVTGAAELPLVPLDRRPGRRGVKGQHCDYIRLCDVGCASGEKFLVQGEQGVRRQFLVTSTATIVIFLARGKKARDCSGPGWSILTDLTASLPCKAVPGANNTLVAVEEEVATTTPGPPDFPAQPPVVCPCSPPYTNPWNPSQGRCRVEVVSTRDTHRVECAGRSTEVRCGGDLLANSDLYSHPLCTTTGYLTVGPLTWTCSSLSPPPSPSCGPV